jgi:virginiamycin A acetyltransferase
MIEISKSAKISQYTDIEDSIRGSRIIIDDDVIIDSFVKIKPTGGLGDVIIGKNSVINSGCVLYTGNGIVLGEGVAVAANCTFAPTNHEFERSDIPIRKQGFKHSRGGIVIGDDVWIGANCVVLDGAIIPHGCVIGAGSVVSGKLEPYSVYVGNPLRMIGKRK